VAAPSYLFCSGLNSTALCRAISLTCYLCHFSAVYPFQGGVQEQAKQIGVGDPGLGGHIGQGSAFGKGTLKPAVIVCLLAMCSRKQICRLVMYALPMFQLIAIGQMMADNPIMIKFIIVARQITPLWPASAAVSMTVAGICGARNSGSWIMS